MSYESRKRGLIQRVKLFKGWTDAQPTGDTLDIPDTVATLDDGGITETGDGRVKWQDTTHGKSWEAPGIANNPGRGTHLNGHEVLAFDGGTAKLEALGEYLANLPAFSLTLLVKGDPSWGGNQFNAYAEDNTAGGFRGMGLYHVSTSDNAHIAAELDMTDDANASVFAQSGDVANDTVNGQWNLLEVVQTTKGSRTVYIDGGNGVVNNDAVGAITLDRSTIGGGFGGLIAFANLKAGAYSADERATIKAHVNSKYALAL